MSGEGGVFFAEARRDGVNIVTIRCRLLCRDLCGAEFFFGEKATVFKFYAQVGYENY